MKFLIIGMQLEAVWLKMLIINIVDGAGLTFIHVSSILSNRKGEMELARYFLKHLSKVDENGNLVFYPHFREKNKDVQEQKISLEKIVHWLCKPVHCLWQGMASLVHSLARVMNL